jgi:single-stranded DNA-binding protein
MFKRNRIELTGNIAKPAKTHQAGEATVTRARLIHNESIQRDARDKLELLTAVEIEIWGRRGKAFEKHVTTKSPVYIEGQLQLSEWEQDGERHFRLFVRVTDWQFLAPKTAIPNQANAA